MYKIERSAKIRLQTEHYEMLEDLCRKHGFESIPELLEHAMNVAESSRIRLSLEDHEILEDLRKKHGFNSINELLEYAMSVAKGRAG